MNEIFTQEPSDIICTCAPGISQFLAKELRDLGFHAGHSTDTTVATEGTLADCMTLNLRLRTAHRVLYTLDKFSARYADRLYDNLVDIPWERYIDPSGYFSIDKVVENDSIQNTNFASLKAKDAIVDRIRAKTGARPNTGNSRHSLCLFLHWVGADASVYIDTTGESLSFRGYRGFTSEAPMRESLAAAIVLASGWDGKTPFVNPMCGCGTIAIEAAWIAQNRPPALYRDNFSFMHLACYEPPMWTNLRASAIKDFEASKTSAPPVIATDIDSRMIDAARENAKLAEVEGLISFDTCDFMMTDCSGVAAQRQALHSNAATPPKGAIIVNPPYGGRMGDPIRLRDIYAGLGVFFKRNRDSYNSFLFTGNPELARDAGLSWDDSRTLFNGAIECEFIPNPDISPEAENLFKRKHKI
ncbi:MAG: class I SAM-dependent RNA methyltransferase [Kiritimatiellaeota bacterium]|nr:class I SAM-dependent RNA methyltransferase [Kiritimatiellota bacterium]